MLQKLGSFIWRDLKTKMNDLSAATLCWNVVVQINGRNLIQADQQSSKAALWSWDTVVSFLPIGASKLFWYLSYAPPPQPDEYGTTPFFKVGPAAGSKPTQSWQFQKCLEIHRHSPKKVRLRRQVINPTSPKKVLAWKTVIWGSTMSVLVAKRKCWASWAPTSGSCNRLPASQDIPDLT